jgi:hypothetical protein
MFSLCSASATVAGVVLASRLLAVDATTGGGTLALDAIAAAAAAIGGSSLFMSPRARLKAFLAGGQKVRPDARDDAFEDGRVFGPADQSRAPVGNGLFEFAGEVRHRSETFRIALWRHVDQLDGDSRPASISNRSRGSTLLCRQILFSHPERRTPSIMEL